ncbi:MAG: hypothetical protein PHY71_05720 [Bacteroidaceae bacterium]|nr:hypothetical protein [Bacteroidaceae bacterium]
MISTDYFQAYEQQLEQLVLAYCEQKGVLGKQLIEVEELTTKWKEMAPYYMADAIPEIAKYPTVSIAWAGYIGRALAAFWDTDWVAYEKGKEDYDSLVKVRGFDCLDEYVTETVLRTPLESEKARQLETLMQEIAQVILTAIRKEEVEPQTKSAFYLFARSTKVMFKISVALELYQRGYKYVKTTLQ